MTSDVEELTPEESEALDELARELKEAARNVNPERRQLLPGHVDDALARLARENWHKEMLWAAKLAALGGIAPLYVVGARLSVESLVVDAERAAERLLARHLEGK